MSSVSTFSQFSWLSSSLCLLYPWVSRKMDAIILGITLDTTALKKSKNFFLCFLFGGRKPFKEFPIRLKSCFVGRFWSHVICKPIIVKGNRITQLINN